MRNYFRKYTELLFWILAILLLALLKPGEDAHHSLCLFKFIGIDFCPGCGLGRSISYFLNGKPLISFQTHPLGIFALLVITHRIYTLIKIHFITPNQIIEHELR